MLRVESDSPRAVEFGGVWVGSGFSAAGRWRRRWSVRRWQYDPDDPPGDEPVEVRIAEAIQPELFVDEADGGDFVVRTTHRVEPASDERSRITYRMEITGLAAEIVGPEIGPEISGDFPQVLAALAARAEGRA